MGTAEPDSAQLKVRSTSEASTTGQPATTGDMPHLLDFERVAEILALPGSRHVRTLVANGALPIVKIGRYPRVRAEDVAALIERQLQQRLPKDGR